MFPAGLGGMDCQSPETATTDKTTPAQIPSPVGTLTPKETKVRASCRRKSVASVSFKDNIGNLQKRKDEASRNSLPEITNKEEKVKKNPTQRRKSMAALSKTQAESEEVLQRRVSTRRRSVMIAPMESKTETRNPEKQSKKSLEKIEMFLESDRNASKDSAACIADDTETLCDNNSESEKCGENCENPSETVEDKYNHAPVDERNSKMFTKTKSRRRSSMIAAKHIENLLDDGNLDTDVQPAKNQNASKNMDVKILKPKKRLLAAYDMEPHSFLIEPTMCSEKVFSKLLDNTPDSTSTQVTKKDKKLQGRKRKNHSVDESQNTPKKCRKSNEKSESSSNSKATRSAISENESSLVTQNLNKEQDVSRDVSENESTLGSSMSVVFSESTCSNLFNMTRPRQSIDEFNLRTKFNSKKVRRKKKALSDSAFSSLNTGSDSSSTAEEDKKVRKMKRNPSFTKTSPQRPSLVMTSLHSQ